MIDGWIDWSIGWLIDGCLFAQIPEMHESLGGLAVFTITN
jgi:hypothetical protein